MSLSNEDRLVKRLINESEPECDPGDFRCDGISCLLALSLDHHIPLFTGGISANPNGIDVRVGSGTFSTVNLSRLTTDLSGELCWPWYGEEDLFGRNRPTGQKVAMKTMSRHDYSDQSKVLVDIAREIRILGHSNVRENRNVVDLIGLDWGPAFPEGQRWPLLLLEYANCGTLEDFFNLEDLNYTWEIKTGIAYDIANGLEALDDAGILHGDLKLSNLLVFREGADSFTVKICDFGSAIISIDFDSETPIRQTTFTPPWDAPESLQEIHPDDLYKVDIYCYGLLSCRIFLKGGDPFDLKFRAEPPSGELSKDKLKIIRRWKEDDIVHEICKSAVRTADGFQYTDEELEMLDRLFDVTVRTDAEDRASEYSEIKTFLNPGRAEMELQQREVFSFTTLQTEIIPLIFGGDWECSIPSIGQCCGLLLPKNMETEIVNDIKRIASLNSTQWLAPDFKPRAAAAAYALSLSNTQGFGSNIDYDEASRWLIQSAELGFVKSQEQIYRLLGAMGIPLPESLRHKLPEWTAQSAIRGNPQAMDDLLKINQSLFNTTKERIRTIYGGVGIDVFGETIRADFNLDEPRVFIRKICDYDAEIPDEFFEEGDGEGLTWLHYAANNGSYEAVQLLLQRNEADINCLTRSGGWSPLWMACAAGHFETAMLLLKNGADPKISSEIGTSCLHHLLSFDSHRVEAVVNALLDRSAEIDAQDYLGKTPLHVACVNGDNATKAIMTLIQRNADPLRPDKDGCSALDQAARKLLPDILSVLLESPHFSGVAGESRAVKAKAQALKHMIKYPKFSRLHAGGLSYKENLDKILHMLISHSVVDAYVQDAPERSTPLQDACAFSADDLVKLLLTYPEIEINGSAEMVRRSPLFAAISRGDDSIISILLEGGAHITGTDTSRRNILHYTVMYMTHRLPEIIERLEKAGLVVSDLVNAGMGDRGVTPFDLAVLTEHFDCADQLLRYGAEINNFTRPIGSGAHYTSLGLAAGSRRQMSYLLELKSPFERPHLVVCDNGFTIFHLIACSFDNAMLESDPSPAENIIFLLDHYATTDDANQADPDGNTPLHIAAYLGSVAVAETLLTCARADVNARNKDGATPLDQFELRKQGLLPNLKELQLVDDLEKRTWKRTMQKMGELFQKHVAKRGNQSRDETSESA